MVDSNLWGKLPIYLNSLESIENNKFYKKIIEHNSMQLEYLFYKNFKYCKKVFKIIINENKKYSFIYRRLFDDYKKEDNISINRLNYLLEDDRILNSYNFKTISFNTMNNYEFNNFILKLLNKNMNIIKYVSTESLECENCMELNKGTNLFYMELKNSIYKYIEFRRDTISIFHLNIYDNNGEYINSIYFNEMQIINFIICDLLDNINCEQLLYKYSDFIIDNSIVIKEINKDSDKWNKYIKDDSFYKKHNNPICLSPKFKIKPQIQKKYNISYSDLSYKSVIQYYMNIKNSIID